ncbi:acyltransferase family protein [Hymenobacter armeniacus]|uniref:Acyltransferase n=1 Tax=Hymenobacter armeniacus TaxID=2771358 RepID=A0ABR8JR29_9BACT|nr:acyltransferase [Hymenobacter armeniacus]MBD2721782.1 acyltransferase [Hymenobacter armeniacus]
MKALDGLTGLRFLAAFYVFVFHIHLRLPLSFLPAPAETIVSMGALGVNIFFVLSGFILTYAHLKDFPASELPTATYYKSFMLKRMARIYPAYLVGLVLCLAVSIGLNHYPAPFPLVVALDLTMIQSYFPSLAMLWYGGGAWSVSTEFFFYLLFPFLLPLLLKVSGTNLRYILVAVVVASSLPGLYYALHEHTVRFQTTYAFPPSRLPEFIAGVILGLLVLRHNFRVSERVTLGLIIFAALYLAKFGARAPGYTVHNFVALPAIMALICVLAQEDKSLLFRWVGSKPMQYLGRISFSFYIMQLPILVLLEGLMLSKFVVASDLYLAIPILAINLVLAAVLYEGVEKRAHKFLSSRIAKLYNIKALQPVKNLV